MTTTQRLPLSKSFGLFFFPLMGLVALFGFGHDWYLRGRPDTALLIFVVVPVTAFGAAYLYRWVTILMSPPRPAQDRPALASSDQVLAEIQALKERVAQLEASLARATKG